MQETDAIQALNEAGFHAYRRDWSLGRSIFVGLGRQHHAGITSYRRMRCIYPVGQLWHVIDFVKDDLRFPSLEDAVEHVMTTLTLEGDDS